MSATTDATRRSQFEGLVDTVYEPVQRYLRRRVSPDDVSELLDDVLVVLWRRLDDVPPDNPLPWVYGVARNTIANHRRGETRRLRLVRRLESSFEKQPPPTAGPTSASDVALWQALHHLSDNDRELVRLWAWEQLEPREIAVALDTTANAVSLRLTRLKKTLRSEIERQNAERAGHEVVGHRQENTL